MEKEEAGSDRGDRSRNSSLSAVQKEVNSGWQIAKVSEFESHGAQESNHPEGEKEGYYSGSTSSDDGKAVSAFWGCRHGFSARACTILWIDIRMEPSR